ncbi:DEAD/DEAH box helicase [Candidatus Pacearchaeota archaeon]|nr:DEAD/DEAH box helicase [Candidatus Pacearchaeota archaeon]
MVLLQPREYQRAIVETCKQQNTLVVLPTGLGKTLIALFLAVHRLEKFPGEKVLFLAPTRPLIEQHLEYFKNQLPELFAQMELFTGNVPPKQRTLLFNQADIIFSTPQCIANDLSNGLYSLQNISLLIIDEAHRCLKNYDYTKVVKSYKENSLHMRILGLTASPGSDLEIVNHICKHLNIEEIEIRTRDSPDVKEYLQELEFQKVEVPFPKEFMEIKVLLKRIYDSKIEQLHSRNLLFGPVNKITLLKTQTRLASQASPRNFNALVGMSLTAQAIKISHAMELLETQTLAGLSDYLQGLVQQAKEKKTKGVQTLVNSSEFQVALLSLNNLLKNKIEHPKIEEAYVLIENELKENNNNKTIIFTQFRDTAKVLSDRLSQNPEIRPAIFIGQAKKKNLGLSQKEQKAIIEQFKTNEINTLIATSIGEEGLDIPEVSLVIFYEPIPSAIRSIQRRGRTARLSKGKLIILITKDTRDVIHHYASAAREKKMHTTIHKVKEDMKNERTEKNNKDKVKTLKDFT